MRQPSTRSFILLSVFKKVDFPQPDGPIKAVILFFCTDILISLSAWFVPYHKFKCSAFMISSIKLPCLSVVFLYFVIIIKYYIFFRCFAASLAPIFIISVIIKSIAAIENAVPNSPLSFAYIYIATVRVEPALPGLTA